MHIECELACFETPGLECTGDNDDQPTDCEMEVSNFNIKDKRVHRMLHMHTTQRTCDAREVPKVSNIFCVPLSSISGVCMCICLKFLSMLK